MGGGGEGALKSQHKSKTTQYIKMVKKTGEYLESSQNAHKDIATQPCIFLTRLSACEGLVPLKWKRYFTALYF